jgi:inosine-uridine nucleoside N-ribohydrolase
MHDASAAVRVVAPELFTTRAGPVRAVCEGIALGQTIQSAGGRRWSHGEAWEGLPAQQVCTAVQGDGVLELFLGSFGGTLRR